MHTVELLEQALLVSKQAGYRVRREWLGMDGGGCQLNGQKWLFLDLGASPGEQLAVVLETLRGEPTVSDLELSHELHQLLALRRCA